MSSRLPSPVFDKDYFDALLETQFWPEERLRDHQRSLLEILLRHARVQVPFYTDRLDPLFGPDGAIKWDRWGDIPILKRSDLLEHRTDMLARELPPGAGKTFLLQTSGSTGPPATTTHTMLAQFATRGALFRAQRWHNIDWSKNVCRWSGGDDIASWPDGLTEGPWGPRWDAGASEGRSLRISRSASAEQAIEFMQRRRVSYLGARGKTAQTLALAAEAAGVSLPLMGVQGFATGFTTEERDDCRRVFGCEVASLYASKEGHGMACQCTTGTHFHVNAEIVLLEVLDDDGQPCQPGETGRVVVTPFYSAAQPLIRYEQGDLAVVGGSCRCGRTLPVLESIVGRTMHLFRFPDGTRVAPMMPEGFREWIGAHYWQLAQVGPYDIEVRYVPDENLLRSRNEAVVVQAIQQRLHVDARVTFVRKKDLERIDGGKFIQYVYEVATTS